MENGFKVAVDARPLAPPLTGIGRYATELLAQMISQTPSWTWLLYSTVSLPGYWLEYPNVKVRQIKFCPRLCSTFFAQTFFVHWALIDQPHVFWSPRHHLPLLLPKTIRRVVTVHDLVWKVYPETMSRFGKLLDEFLMPRSVQGASHVCTVSNSTRIDLGKFLQKTSNVSVIPPAASHFGSSIFKSVSDLPYFLFVGTKEPRKNLARLIRAFLYGFEQGISVTELRIVGGGGWGQGDLAQLAEELGLKDNIIFYEYVSDEFLDELYLGAFALVMPSLYEGFGIPLIEAMAHGVPVITSNCSSMPEVVADAGLLVDPLNEKDISSAMLRMANESDLRDKLSHLARIRSGFYSWEASATAMLPVLNGAISD